MAQRRGFFLEVLAEFLELVARIGRFLLFSGTFLREEARYWRNLQWPANFE
jgi:hypothetical protein